MFDLILMAAAATIVASLPNWKIEKSKDMLTDEISCTGYYRGRRDIQLLSNDTLYVLTKFSPKEVTLRFGDEAPLPMRSARRDEQELRGIVIKLRQDPGLREINAQMTTSAEKLLALHEEEKKKLSEEYERRKELYNQGLISLA